MSNVSFFIIYTVKSDVSTEVQDQEQHVENVGRNGKSKVLAKSRHEEEREKEDEADERIVSKIITQAAAHPEPDVEAVIAPELYELIRTLAALERCAPSLPLPLLPSVESQV